MKIYTKKGDKATTSLLGQSDVPKHHRRIEAYGTVDELNVALGSLRDYNVQETIKQYIIELQAQLFSIGSHLATAPGNDKIKLPKIEEGWISNMEHQIDAMEEKLPEMRNFVLPGGHPSVSSAHLARVVCRRAERRVSEVNEIEEVNSVILQYLNRLSDYLFVLSRYLTMEFHVQEDPWKPEY